MAKQIKPIKAWACISSIQRGEIDGLWGMPNNWKGKDAIVYMIYHTKKQAEIAKGYYSIEKVIPVLITPIKKKSHK